MDNERVNKKSSKGFILILVGFLIFMAVAYVAYDYLADKTDKDNVADNGGDYVYAIDFTVYDIDGNTVKLSDYIGKPIVLNFWASWCYPCKMEMPDFNTAYKEYEGEVQFLMVNLTDGTDETVESASSFIDEMGYEFPVFYDKDLDAAVKYGVTGIPSTYFIDAQGRLFGRANSVLSLDILKQAIGDMMESSK